MRKRINITLAEELIGLIPEGERARTIEAALVQYLHLHPVTYEQLFSTKTEVVEYIKGLKGKHSQPVAAPGTAAVAHPTLWKVGDKVELVLNEFYRDPSLPDNLNAAMEDAHRRAPTYAVYVNGVPTGKSLAYGAELFEQYESQGVTITRLDSSAAGHTNPAPAPKPRHTGDAPRKFYLYWTDKYGDEYGEVINGKRVEYGKYHEGDIPEGAVIVSDTREEDKAEHDAVFGDLDND